MGHNNSKARLQVIMVNVDQISKGVRSGHIKFQDRERYQELLHDYSQEIKFILSKSLSSSKISKVEQLIHRASEELDSFVDSRILQRIDSDINYLTKLKVKERKEKRLHDLEEIGKSMTVISDTLKVSSFKKEKETLQKVKNELDSIEEIDEEVNSKKTEALAVLAKLENVSLEIEVEDKLKQIMDKHNQYKVDLKKFVGIPESEAYKKHKHFLIQLKEEVWRILEVSEKVCETKKYILYNIDNNLVALDQVVKENEERINSEIGGNANLKVTVATVTNQKLIENLVECYKQFEKGFSANCNGKELKDTFKKLNELKIKINQKLKVLENQLDGDLPPKKRRMEVIQKEVETVRKEIENSTYSKDSQIYNNFKNQLDDYKAELKTLQTEGEDGRKFRENILRYVDDVAILLDDHISKRNSTSGDLLVDIESIGTSVNELGDKLKDCNCGLNDYKSIEDRLEDYLHNLKHLQISGARTNICKFRDYVILQIESHLSNLRRLKSSQKTAEGEIGF